MGSILRLVQSAPANVNAVAVQANSLVNGIFSMFLLYDNGNFWSTDLYAVCSCARFLK